MRQATPIIGSRGHPASHSWRFTPIGVFHCAERFPYDAPRQGAAGGCSGVARLEKGHGYEEALNELSGFSRIWILYVFHKNSNWRPMIQPPRGRHKVGVFASRAPYRPNPIGLTCAELVAVDGLELTVRGHDLLDGTPILDIKPYLAYADSFPEAASGWLAETAAEPLFEVALSTEAAASVEWLKAHGVSCLEDFLRRQLERDPLSRKRKRVRPLPDDDGLWEIAYRTWRAAFRVDPGKQQALVLGIESGYSAADLANPADPHKDKALHREFLAEKTRTDNTD